MTDNNHPAGTTPGAPVPAAQYVRMSTEHQQYSTANQEDAIDEYARRRGFEVVRTYADEGRSGLTAAGRDALRGMIADVQAGRAEYRAILVYDVSRWGRFQDADESAYYEYLCRRAGIEVHYCAEQFENDGGPAATIIKSVKRAMAGEYSRELSAKVFQGQCRLIELGYRQGGAPGYGLRRMLVSHTGERKGVLPRGERKGLQTDRVILVPGPDGEVAVVRWVYEQFTRHGKRETEIAAALNDQGLVTDLGRPWTRGTVNQLLTNEKYIGNNVYNRTSFKLKKKHVGNPPDMWVRSDRAFEPVVPPEDFFVARGIIRERTRRVSSDDMLDHLRRLGQAVAVVSARAIDADEAMPSAAAYRSRFGGLLNALRLAGLAPARDYGYVEVNRGLRTLYGGLVADLTRRLGGAGATVAHDAATGLLVINREYSATLVVSRCRRTPAGSLRWVVRLDRRVAPDITVLARMDPANARPADYYLLPLMDIDAHRLLLCEANGAHLDTYQFDTLDQFDALARRRPIEVPA
jgi:DNA invertase Pin-like site-specific DNA recombinase